MLKFVPCLVVYSQSINQDFTMKMSVTEGAGMEPVRNFLGQTVDFPRDSTNGNALEKS